MADAWSLFPIHDWISSLKLTTLGANTQELSMKRWDVGGLYPVQCNLDALGSDDFRCCRSWSEIVHACTSLMGDIASARTHGACGLGRQ